jgi:aspartate/methionine/tyrosine aminotransferase
MKPSRDFALEVYFSKWEFKARYNMAGSDIQSMSLTELLDLASPADRKHWETLSLGYTETYGLPELREVIAGTYETLQAKHILCFAGAEEALYIAMQAILKPGDHALVCYPNYQSAETLPLDICETEGILLDPQEDWSLDLEKVRAAVRPNTRLISINFPNNPTGKILEREKFEALVTLCRERGIYLFSDEVYRLIERDPQRRLPQAADVYERGLSLNVMSKAYGFAGLRIGWIACQDTGLLQTMEHMKHYLSICNSAPSEILAMIALRARETILARNRQLVDSNLLLLDAFFKRHPDLFEWKIPDGSPIGFPRYLGADGVEAFAARLVNQCGVLLLPSSMYRSGLGPVPQDRFRVGYGRAFLAEALPIWEENL